VNVRPAESLTEKAAPDGQQSQPTMTTSFDLLVVRERLHAVTYPHPVEAEPSIAIPVAVDVDVVLVLLFVVVADGEAAIASTITSPSSPTPKVQLATVLVCAAETT
jgi:hypothetical protein